MKIERDERRFDFHDIGLAIKRAREAAGMTQEQLAYIVDRAPRTIMYNENDGQHPSFNTFYQNSVASLVACAYLQNLRMVSSVLKAGSLNRAFWNSSISFTSSGAAFFPGPSCQVVHHRWPS